MFAYHFKLGITSVYVVRLCNPYSYSSLLRVTPDASISTTRPGPMSAECCTCPFGSCYCYGAASRGYASMLADGEWTTSPGPGPLCLAWSLPLGPSATPSMPSFDAGAGSHAVRQTASPPSLRLLLRPIPPPIWPPHVSAFPLGRCSSAYLI